MKGQKEDYCGSLPLSTLSYAVFCIQKAAGREMSRHRKDLGTWNLSNMFSFGMFGDKWVSNSLKILNKLIRLWKPLSYCNMSDHVLIFLLIAEIQLSHTMSASVGICHCKLSRTEGKWGNRTGQLMVILIFWTQHICLPAVLICRGLVLEDCVLIMMIQKPAVCPSSPIKKTTLK